MAFLRGFGAWTPERVVANDELAARLNCDAGWIFDVSGIRERRYANESTTVVDLAVKAAEDCLSRCGTDRSKIGMVIVSCGAAERRFPGPAAEVARRLELTDRPAIDLPMASAGTLFGMALAAQMAGACGDVLVVGAEKMSSVVDREPLDRNIAILFGDGAGACLVSPSGGRAEIADWILRSDGSFSDALKLDLGGPMSMNGLTVILQAARKVPKAMKDLLLRNRVEPTAVDVYLMHQANQNLIAKIARGLGVEASTFYSNIERFGNTSSASMLIAAAEWAERTGFLGGPVVFGAFGAGFHWGALLARPVAA